MRNSLLKMEIWTVKEVFAPLCFRHLLSYGFYCGSFPCTNMLAVKLLEDGARPYRRKLKPNTFMIHKHVCLCSSMCGFEGWLVKYEFNQSRATWNILLGTETLIFSREVIYKFWNECGDAISKRITQRSVFPS